MQPSKPFKQAGKKYSPAKKTDRLQTHKTYPDYLIPGIIILFTFLLYLPSLKNGFVNWDDHAYIHTNGSIQRLGWENIKIMFSSFYMGNYHPLTLLIYAFNYSVSGGQPAMSYHLLSLLLHLVNIILVYYLIKLITRNLVVAAVAAFCFGIHPMRVESVAWISDLKDLLYGVFFLSALISYYYYYLMSKDLKDKRTPTKKSGQTQYFIMTMGFFLLSLLSKAAAVMFPVVMILLDFLLNRKFSSKVVIEKIPFFLLSLFFGILAVKAQHSASAIQENISQFYSPVTRFFLINSAFSRYILMFLFPVHLSALHPYPILINQKLSLLVYLSPLFNLGILGLIVYSLKFSRNYFFGLFFFLVNIVIVLQILPVGNAIVSERYSYIPYVGLFFITGIVMAHLVQTKNIHKYIKIVAVLTFIVFSTGFSITTYARLKVWKDGYSLWNDVIRKYPEDNISKAYNNRGNLYFERNIYDSAYADYIHGMKLDRTSPLPFGNLGVIYGKWNRLDSSLICLNKAIELDPKNYPYFYANRGLTYDGMGKSELAAAEYKKCLEFHPNDDKVVLNLALAYQKSKRFTDAMDLFNNLITKKPGEGVYYLYRSVCFSEMGKTGDALIDATKAHELGADVPEDYLKSLKQHR
ncbi:MAG: tetratricopeptide repeat protein [Bacteroidetes bacterium]|nr:tetratricopeptide repeat protein [Bacteroidota bacterium]